MQWGEILSEVTSNLTKYVGYIEHCFRFLRRTENEIILSLCAHINKAIDEICIILWLRKLTNFVKIGKHFAVRNFESDCEIRLQKTFHLNVIHLWQENFFE